MSTALFLDLVSHCHSSYDVVGAVQRKYYKATTLANLLVEA